MNKKVKLLVSVFFIVTIAWFGYNYIMTSGGRNLKTEKSEFVVTAANIFDEFSTNSEIATSKYVNKAVQISGTISNSTENVIMLNGKVSCELNVSEKLTLGSEVKVKGRVIGYDDLLEELKLDQCLIVK